MTITETIEAPALGSFGRAAIAGDWRQDAPNPGGPVIDPNAPAGPLPFGRKPPLPAPAQPPAAPAVTVPSIPGERLRALFGAMHRTRQARDAAIWAAEAAHRAALQEARDRLAALSARRVPAHQREAAQHALERLERTGADRCEEAREVARLARLEYESARKLARGV